MTPRLLAKDNSVCTFFKVRAKLRERRLGKTETMDHQNCPRSHLDCLAKVFHVDPAVAIHAAEI